MDEQNKSDSEKPVVNDIVPPPMPPADQSDAPKMTIPVVDSTDENNEANEDPGAEDAVATDDNNAESAPPSMAKPPEETTENEAPDSMNAESISPSGEDQEQKTETATTAMQPSAVENTTVEDKQAPAEMGVAASQMSNAQSKPSNRNNKKLAAIVTIVVALLLAATAVYVYMSANKNTKSSNSQTGATNNSQEQNTVADSNNSDPATTTSVDTTSSEIDAAINALDDTNDFAETNLSDTTLNL